MLPYQRTPQPRPEDQDGEGMLPVLALHLRRGDFEEHCKNLALWGSSFMGFVSLAEFEERDAFRPPQVVEPVKPAEEEVELEVAEGQSSPETDDLRKRRRAENAGDALEDKAAYAQIKVTVPSTGEVASSTVFIGHAYNDASVMSSDERSAMYARHCYPDNQQIVQRVRDVLKDWVARRWISFVEQHERDIAGKRDENEAAYEAGLARWKEETLGKMKAVYLMTNGKKEWAAEVRKALRGLDGEGEGVAEGLSRWEFRFMVDVEVQREGSGVGPKMKRRTLEWTVAEWPWNVDQQEAFSGGKADKLGRGRSPILITTARDLEFTLEEKYAAQAVDMYIGQRAEVFIGNGVRSRK